MALGFMADLYGIEVAKRIAQGIEYVWNSDKDNDKFSLWKKLKSFWFVQNSGIIVRAALNFNIRTEGELQRCN